MPLTNWGGVLPQLTNEVGIEPPILNPEITANLLTSVGATLQFDRASSPPVGVHSFAEAALRLAVKCVERFSGPDRLALSFASRAGFSVHEGSRADHMSPCTGPQPPAQLPVTGAGAAIKSGRGGDAAATPAPY